VTETISRVDARLLPAEPATTGEAKEPDRASRHDRGPSITGDLNAWNAALERLGGHLLQSWEWGSLKARHGWTPRRIHVATADGDALAQVLFRRKGPVSIGYLPRGPAIGQTRNPALLFCRLRSELDAICRANRAISLIVEPDRPLGLPGSYRDVGYVRGPRALQPSLTVKVPLLPDEQLLNQMHPKNRYNVRLAQRRGVVVERGGGDPASLDVFFDLLRDTAERNAFGIHEKAYYDDVMRTFGDRALMLFGLVDGQVAAGSISAYFGDEAIYLYGASSSKHRAHAAAFLLQYEAMRWAREHGCRRYDLWGIPEDDPGPEEPTGDGMPPTQGEDRRGLRNFKVRFGGEIITYPVPMERRYRPLLAVAARRLAMGRG
jgi:lipid II:glycine glycyltransferase (peptidoglycan interpeptide bridge formation enzyme)